MSEWQPIETAPKDGRFFILLCGDNVIQYTVVISHCDDVGFVLDWSPHDDYFVIDYVHGWQPLPITEFPVKKS